MLVEGKKAGKEANFSDSPLLDTDDWGAVNSRNVGGYAPIASDRGCH